MSEQGFFSMQLHDVATSRGPAPQAVLIWRDLHFRCDLESEAEMRQAWALAKRLGLDLVDAREMEAQS